MTKVYGSINSSNTQCLVPAGEPVAHQLAQSYRKRRHRLNMTEMYAYADAMADALERQPAHNAEKPRCTCPSGDGSLRWPCPRHPPESA